MKNQVGKSVCYSLSKFQFESTNLALAFLASWKKIMDLKMEIKDSQGFYIFCI